MYTTLFTITNITCDACVKLSKMALKNLPGVTSVDIDQKTGEGTLISDVEISGDDVLHALKEVKKEAIIRL
ncbi:MAG: heavy-metal-associated domain-containing protein [Candidatus Magasanikbacteria bacterium]|nr:heavy-metal-associated domain-containing protein [Candidatus Magasanikbacteria bacterium]